MCPYLGDAPLELSAAEPAVCGLTVDAELFGEFLQCYLVVIPTGNMARPDGPLLSKSLSHQKLLDDQRVEHGFLRRRPAFRIEIVSDLSSGRPLSTEGRDPIQYFVVMLQLFEASHGADNRMRRLAYRTTRTFL